MKKLIQKIKDFFALKRKQKEISDYVKSIPRDSKGRWIFPDKVKDTPVELLSSREWMNVKRILGDEKTWQVPCTCGNVQGGCVC